MFRVQLGATVFAATVLLVFLAVFSSGAPSVDDALIYEVANNRRPVLLFATIKPNRLMVIIGGTYTNDDTADMLTNDTHVFDQPLDSSFGFDYVALNHSRPLGVLWPPITQIAGEWYKRMFLIADEEIKDEFLILVNINATGTSSFQLNLGVLEPTRLYDEVSYSFRFGSKVLSSMSRQFWYFQGDQLILGHFEPSSLSSATSIKWTTILHICQADVTLLASTGDCESANATAMDWDITGGFTNATTVVLVDSSNAVYIFSRSVLSSLGKKVSFMKIPAEMFWIKWIPGVSVKPYRKRTRMMLASTEKKAPRKVATKWPLVLILGAGLPSAILVIGFFAVCIYCLCQCGGEQTEESAAVVESAVKQPQSDYHKARKKTTHRSKRKSRGRRSSDNRKTTKKASTSVNAGKSITKVVGKASISTTGGKSNSKMVGKASTSATVGSSVQQPLPGAGKSMSKVMDKQVSKSSTLDKSTISVSQMAKKLGSKSKNSVVVSGKSTKVVSKVALKNASMSKRAVASSTASSSKVAS